MNQKPNKKLSEPDCRLIKRLTVSL